MADITHIGITTIGVMGTLVIAYLVMILMPKESYLPSSFSGQAQLHKLLALVIVIALADFYFVSFIPAIGRIEDLQLQYVLVGIFLVFSLISIIATMEIRNVVLDIRTSVVDRNEKFLGYCFKLILMQEVVVTLFYLGAIVSLALGVDKLPGVEFIFNFREAEIAEIDEFSGSEQVALLLLTGIKGAFLILHHGSILVVFVTLLAIFQEWNNRVGGETPINFFTVFTLGYLVQGIGQVIQCFAVFYAPFFLTSDDKVPSFLSLPTALGSVIILFGQLVYYISFMLAALSLLNNISHLVLPKWLRDICKVAAVIFPIIYGILYSLLALLSLLWVFSIGGAGVEDLAEDLILATHLLDLPAMILLPLTCGLFFLVAYYQGRTKEQGQELGNYVLWTFLALFLVFGVGNNTMSGLSWFGMLHGPLALLGALLLLYGLSRVADHASRHRRVIKHIRENPDDFIFLAKLGEAERKIQCWGKVDSLVKTGVIKPLVPTEQPPDKTQVAAEINSYMAEITKAYARRTRRRRPIPTSGWG